MEKSTFNPWEWMNDPAQQATAKPTVNNKPTDNYAEVEQIIEQIEARSLDITSAYSNWRDIGFALAGEFGESGRDLFHRISRFYPEYSTQECDRQYNNCLKSKGQGITLKSFFYHAKQAGIPLSRSVPGNPELREKEQKEDQSEQMPNLPDTLFPQLPEFLHEVISVATSNEERDILLLGSLASMSACLPKIHGIYDGRMVYPNLYLFVTAKASAGKGRLVHCKQLVKPVHQALREQAAELKRQYDIDLAAYNANKGDEDLEKPAKPPEKMLFIPANNSTTGVFQLLSDSDGKGLIFETEGDTLAHAFKSDYGNYSDGFRKAFHHETISYYRRTDREYVDLESPRLSAVLSGTPRQISALIPSAENGLFSRFIFYYMNVTTEWKDVFAQETNEGLDDHFDRLGDQFYDLYKILLASPDIRFSFTADQQSQFNRYFSSIQERYLATQGIDYMATVRRLGLIAFRIAMILSALRIMETGDASDEIYCEERDFNTALSIIKVLVKHSSQVFSELPEEEKPKKRKNQKEKFLEKLPPVFNRQQYLEVARELRIPDKTAEGYISNFLDKAIHRDRHNHYVKIRGTNS